ncbi:phospholipase D-like domain-containing protein [Microbulbifer litoralis]|uniref:phospholipase D-like domain-containing protein n=1 Tax=Microbulbifer litoralis TaxID=2933965 RepID=UPI00202950AF|nr:phospholipase D family protein [Microbulbifer sp. GX H0434]
MRYLLPLFTLCLCACSGTPVFPEPPPRAPSFHREAPPAAPLVAITDRLTRGRAGRTGVYPLTSAQSALAVRLASIRAARGSIDIQYFIFRRDDTGLLLTRALIRAADRGVRVRFLLDDFTTGDADKVLVALDRHPNIEIRLFNPFPHEGPRAVEFFTDFARLQRRMHNKSLTVDNRVTFIGGRNLSNKYFGIDSEINFGDLDMLAIGAVVPEIAGQFDRYWNSPYSFPVQSVIDYRPDADADIAFAEDLERNASRLLGSDYGRSLARSPVIDTLSNDADLWYWAETRALYDPPGKVAFPPAADRQFAGRELMEMITGAERELIVISPYLLPGRRYLRQLIAAARRGVEVHILTNSLASTEVVLVHGAYRKYRRPLLRAGVHLHELSSDLDYRLDNWNGESRSLLHAKAFVIDRKRVYVGSFNLDNRSILLNTELGLVIESPQLAAKMAKNFIRNVGGNAYRLELRGDDLLWHRSDGETASTDPDTNWLQRAASVISGWLPIESLL